MNFSGILVFSSILSAAGCANGSSRPAAAQFASDAPPTMTLGDVYADMTGANPNNIAINSGSFMAALGSISFSRLATTYTPRVANTTVAVDSLQFTAMRDRLAAHLPNFANLDSRYANIGELWSAAGFDPNAVPSESVLKAALQAVATTLTAPPAKVQAAAVCQHDLSFTQAGFTTALAGSNVMLSSPTIGMPLMLAGIIAAGDRALSAGGGCIAGGAGSGSGEALE